MMPSIVFEPWEGSRYRQNSQFGLRVLVLGESHYGQESETYAAFTQDVIRTTAKYKGLAFFTKVSKVLLNLDDGDLDDEQRAEIWEHVSYYNFIQKMLPGPGVPPTEVMWQRSAQPYFEVLERLQPELVLVLGKRLKDHLPLAPASFEFAYLYHPAYRGFRYKDANLTFSEAKMQALKKKQERDHKC